MTCTSTKLINLIVTIHQPSTVSHSTNLLIAFPKKHFNQILNLNVLFQSCFTGKKISYLFNTIKPSWLNNQKCYMYLTKMYLYKSIKTNIIISYSTKNKNSLYTPTNAFEKI